MQIKCLTFLAFFRPFPPSCDIWCYCFIGTLPPPLGNDDFKAIFVSDILFLVHQNSHKYKNKAQKISRHTLATSLLMPCIPNFKPNIGVGFWVGTGFLRFLQKQQQQQSILEIFKHWWKQTKSVNRLITDRCENLVCIDKRARP